MDWIIRFLWLIPVLPLGAAGVLALCRRSQRPAATALSLGTIGLSFLLSCVAFIRTLSGGEAGEPFRQWYNFEWLQFGSASLRLGWVLDPLTAVMLVMVSFVGLLIFIYSVAYMAHDANFTRFFCFLSLFAAAMLGLVMANSLLLLFVCWELVGLASFLLIGFWFEKPSAAQAAQKAFITTRVGDIGFFIGMIWLYSETGTLLFFDGGQGCLEQGALSRVAAQVTAVGITAATGIGLLIFCGAMGKSGQVPLHVWLPDAMEGPTPVSALIHAATMVAAGVFLLARVYPLLDADPSGAAGMSPALTFVTWVGAITALFAATVAVAQTDIKRILAYSTVSQLGFMMVGIGAGGVAAGIFHLITHAFFKALLFLGAGSVIHGCDGEQDIRRMGGLRTRMPVTFATYMVGMMALAGVPLFFSGFWSKDEILHAALHWPVTRWPFVLVLVAAFLTAFYMMRQVGYVFLGRYRGHRDGHAAEAQANASHGEPHESPALMTWPLAALAVFAVVLGFFGTPAWPGFQGYVEGRAIEGGMSHLFEGETLLVMLLSTLVVLGGLGLGWSWYGRTPPERAEEADALERLRPGLFAVLRDKWYVDEFYQSTVIAWNRWWARASDWLDRAVWSGVVAAVSYIVLGFSWLNRLIDEYVINAGFNAGCSQVRGSGKAVARVQSGQLHHYLRVIGIGVAVLALFLAWGCRP